MVVDDPTDPRTDVGPVIDQGAYDRLMTYRESVRERWLHTIGAPSAGLFVPPTMIRTDRIEDVTKEWFGPLLHVTTWPAASSSRPCAGSMPAALVSQWGFTAGSPARP
jgi:RHH-type proline utilization regulon transcriptional repressor/proline dehydrogenase/delta 1-pyrroline-5-carboxylate dehydrogenase